jgi:hypothetical protein
LGSLQEGLVGRKPLGWKEERDDFFSGDERMENDDVAARHLFFPCF